MLYGVGSVLKTGLNYNRPSSQAFSIVTRMGSNYFLTLRSRKSFAPKVTKMGSIIGHKID